MSTTNKGRAGKFQKPKRGGGKHFSRDLRPLDADGGERSMWADPVDEDDSSEEDSSEESSSEDDTAPKQAEQEMTREERRAAAKARKEAAIKRKQAPAQPGDLPPNSDEEDGEDGSSDEDGDMPANPNHTTAARKQAAKATTDPTSTRPGSKVKKPDDLQNLSRREREAIQAQQAKERYQKLHAEGKTEEARSDLERLKLVRQQREEAAARKEAEKQEREEVEKEKKAQLERMERQQKLKAARGGRGAKKGGKS